MKFRLLPFAAALSLSIVLSAGPGFAQAEEIKPEPELVRQMLQEGWIKVAEGVLQRTEWGPVETFTYGEDGLRWTARSREARLELLQKEYASNPSEELAGIIESLKSQLIEMNEIMASGAAGAEVVSPDELADCNISYWATAAADPETGPSAPGVKANASAYFHANCGQIGNSYAYAYARAATSLSNTPPTDIHDDSKYDSSWVDSAASASASGSLDCFSDAYAQAWSPQLNIDYYVEDTNYSCPPAPVTASISGPSDVLLAGCATVTWYASATGGSGAYTYKWYLGTGTIVVSTKSWYSRTYCNSQQVDLRVVATDTSSPVKSDDATFTTWIHY